MTFSDFDIVVRKKSGTEKVTCPKCRDKRTNKKDKSLFVNIDESRWHCFYCEWKGTLEQRADFKKPEYKIPEWKNNTNLSDNIVKWFEKRGISQFTLRQNKITESKEYIPQVSSERNTINFNYFRNNELINIKYRDGEKNFKLFTGAELILYGLDLIKDSTECTICEGEIDMLSYWECGYHSVVSVPNGANKNLAYIDNCIEYFDNKEKIYLATDGDSKGFMLRDELIRRLGAERCYIVDYSQLFRIKETGFEPTPCKDANEVLINHGKDVLILTLTNAKAIRVDGVFEVTDVSERMIYTFRNGKVRGTTTYIQKLDSHWTWRPGEINIWTGYNNEGKSIFLMYLMVLKAKYEDFKFGLFMPENYPIDELFDELIHIYVGKSTDSYYKNVMTELEYQEAMFFIQEHFFVVCPDENYYLETILTKFKYLIKTKGINACVIDPYNQIEHLMERGEREDLYISRFMTKLKRFSIDYSLSFHLIAHQVTPNFSGKENYPQPDSYKIKGGGTFSDKADNVIVVWRPLRKSEPENTIVNIIIAKIKKQKLVGLPGEIQLYYSRSKNQYFETENMDEPKREPLASPKELEQNLDFEYEREEKEVPF
jgi:twinkle protein